MPNLTEICIRRYRRSDRESLAALWVATWNATFPEIDFAEQQDWIGELLDDYAARSDAVTLCATAPDGTLLGFAMLETEPPYLEQIAVARDARGSGVATRILDAVKAQAPGGLALRVNQENPRAVRFYLRAGFRITGEGANPGGRRKTWVMEWRPEPGCDKNAGEKGERT